jgi:hypothetical protein
VYQKKTIFRHTKKLKKSAVFGVQSNRILTDKEFTKMKYNMAQQYICQRTIYNEERKRASETCFGGTANTRGGGKYFETPEPSAPFVPILVVNDANIDLKEAFVHAQAPARLPPARACCRTQARQVLRQLGKWAAADKKKRKECRRW